MKIGVQNGSLLKNLRAIHGDISGEKITVEDSLKFIKDAGFCCVDFSLSTVPFEMERQARYDRFKQIKAYADEIGLEISQTHGHIGYMKVPSWEYLVERAIEDVKTTAILGAKYTVIHPVRTLNSDYGQDLEERKRQNYIFLGALKPYLEDLGVVECVENLFGDDLERKISCPNVCSTPEEILDYINYFNTPNIQACFDVGHAFLTGDLTGWSVPDFVRKLGKHIKVLHVHDNNKVKDDHLPPFMGKMDWKEFYLTLKEIGYDGVISLELVPHHYLSYDETAYKRTFEFACKVSDFEKIFKGEN